MKKQMLEEGDYEDYGEGYNFKDDKQDNSKSHTFPKSLDGFLKK